MCGIIGVMLAPGLESRHMKRCRDSIQQLMLAAQERGVDAAGLMVIQPGQVQVLKAGCPARHLLSSPAAAELLDSITPDTIGVIGHTRSATRGDPEDDENNHPLIDDGICLVHNGIINNWDELDRRYGSLAEVDSAALLAAVRHHSDQALTPRSLAQGCRESRGPIAAVAVDARYPSLVFAYRNVNPLVGATDRYGYWLASTGGILRRAGVARMGAPIPAHRAVRLTPTGPE